MDRMRLGRVLRGAAAALAAMVSAVAMAGTVTYYHNDLAGSPVVATNESGSVIWRESYRPYGERTVNSVAASGNKVWFTSRRHDAETGLVYMGARYYDPVVGRFISTDPIRFDEKNLHTFNRYAYANNNPYRYRDTNGLWAEDLVLAVPGIVLGAVSLRDNLNKGHYIASTVDIAGIVADGVATAIPGVPGGAGLAIAATRKAVAEGAEAASRAALSADQATNLARFEGKLPANATATKIFDLPGGGKAFQADSPSSKIPGSFAQYEKQVGATGETMQYTKTTFGPKGEIVHVRDKINNQTVVP
jgi:RHS repeat-associated protein